MSQSTLIVGGGVIGIAIAHYLQERGHAVTVIDQGRIGGGSSWGNCGYVCPSHSLPLAEPGMVLTGLKSLLNPRAGFRIKPQWRPALFRWLWQFARRCNEPQMLSDGGHLHRLLTLSRDQYTELFATTRLSAQWQPKGLLYVLKTDKGIAAQAHTDDLLQRHFEVRSEFIAGPDLPDIDPALRPDLAGAYWYRQDASLEPAQLVSHWSKHLQGLGVPMHAHCALQSVQTQSGQITGLQTTQGLLQADHYVFAVGAWSGLLQQELACELPVEPCKGYSVTVDRPHGAPQLPMLFPEHRVGLTPFDDTLRLGSMIEFAGFDQSIPPARIKQLFRAAKPYLQHPIQPTNPQPWCGWRPMTWDSLPIIGRVPKFENAWLATGHNMLGITLAPATGKLVAELITDQNPSVDPKPYAPGRF